MSDFLLCLQWLQLGGVTYAECRLIPNRSDPDVKEVWLFAAGRGNQITRCMGAHGRHGEWIQPEWMRA